MAAAIRGKTLKYPRLSREKKRSRRDSRNYGRQVYYVNYIAAADAGRTNRIFVIKDFAFAKETRI